MHFHVCDFFKAIIMWKRLGDGIVLTGLVDKEMITFKGFVYLSIDDYLEGLVAANWKPCSSIY